MAPRKDGVGCLLTTSGIPASYNQTHSVFRDPRMAALLDAYFDQPQMTCIEELCVVKDVIGCLQIAQDLHFDVPRTLQFFLNVTDNDEGNGAFKAAPGSHKDVTELRARSGAEHLYEFRHLSRVPNRTEQAEHVTGQAGDLIIFDTDTLHMVGTCSTGERRVMRVPSSGFPNPYRREAKANQPSKRSWFSRIY